MIKTYFLAAILDILFTHNGQMLSNIIMQRTANREISMWLPNLANLRYIPSCAEVRLVKRPRLILRGGEGGALLDLEMDPEPSKPLKSASDSKKLVKDWSTTSTPEDDKALGVWSAESSLRPESELSEGRHASSSAPSSTGLGVHGNCSWDRLRQIGIPIFELPELGKAAKEASMMRRSRDFAEQTIEWKREERATMAAETARRAAMRERGTKLGLWGPEEGRQIEGEPCSACGRVLCVCEHLAEEEEMRRRGIQDPFERIKDRHILAPGEVRDALPPPPPAPAPAPIHTTTDPNSASPSPTLRFYPDSLAAASAAAAFIIHTSSLIR